MLASIFNDGKAIVRKSLQRLNQKLQAWSQPMDGHAVLETVADLMRPKSELVLENALLRQQVIVLQRQVKRPKMTNLDRRLLVLLASQRRAWRSALLVVKPETLLQWHRELFRLAWRHTSKARAHLKFRENDGSCRLKLEVTKRPVNPNRSEVKCRTKRWAIQAI